MSYLEVPVGTRIPAGQPYWVHHPHGYDAEFESSEGMLVDSSWRPPLNLPTERTWAIVRTRTSIEPLLGHWYLHESGDFRRHCNFAGWNPADLTDFIPLTDEQVARIEAAR